MVTVTQQCFSEWARTGRAEGMERGHKPRALQALEKVPAIAGDSFLDIGCGNGWAACWLAERFGPGASVLGIDFSPDMVTLATEKAASLGHTRVRFESCDFNHIPVEDRTIDHIFSMEALYYSTSVTETLREWHRVLKPGGTLTACIDFYLENTQSHGWPDMLGVPMALHAEEAWKTMLAEAGFEPVKSWRCLDLNNDDPDPDTRAFNHEVGTLALHGVKR